MRVEDLGEFGLIARLTAGLRRCAQGVLLGVGDDAAALRPTPGRLILATVDALVEGVHFLPGIPPPRLLGRKALSVNLSDIAAMGGLPRFALVSLGIPAGTPTSTLDELYAGLAERASEFGVALVGGNVSRSESGLFVDITVLGEVEPDRLLRREGAKPGDCLLLTGHLGQAAAGLALAREPALALAPGVREPLVTAWADPWPRVSEGRVISGSGACTAMIDVSDGLASDLGHLCEAGAVGATVWADRLPVDAGLAAFAEAAGRDLLEVALRGGEEYELLFTARSEASSALALAIQHATGTPVSIIGQVEPKDVGLSLIAADGQRHPLPTLGFQHL